MSIRIEDLATTDFTSVAVSRAKKIAPTSPGETLREEFLKPLGITNYRSPYGNRTEKLHETAEDTKRQNVYKSSTY